MSHIDPAAPASDLPGTLLPTATVAARPAPSRPLPTLQLPFIGSESFPAIAVPACVFHELLDTLGWFIEADGSANGFLSEADGRFGTLLAILRPLSPEAT